MAGPMLYPRLDSLMSEAGWELMKLRRKLGGEILQIPKFKELVALLAELVEMRSERLANIARKTGDDYVRAIEILKPVAEGDLDTMRLEKAELLLAAMSLRMMNFVRREEQNLNELLEEKHRAFRRMY